ncbi:MAG TPA: polysaccharide biosynthesis C-terminal domain-containing protein [Candidatus Binatia bacterium]|nr:polysaccharide biosynthesis C-terminal domain-containing protein [Candidatus Binatia bacterium]
MQAGLSTAVGRTPRSAFGTLARNSAANVARLGVISLVALFLPAYLTHHLAVETYGAWVLIMQMGAYVGYLDFGVQTAVSKYIAEYEARGDMAGCGRCASAGLAIMLAACGIGIVLTGVLALIIPELFQKMPAGQFHAVRIGILFVGTSLSINLASSVYSAIFLGLQRYQVPMITTIISKLAYAIAVCVSVYMHAGLASMGAAVAGANLLGAAAQVIAWRKLASHVHVGLGAVDWPMLRQMLGYCGVLTIWSVCMLFVSGIDLTIVGHYDFGQTAFYSIALSPTNFILMLIGAMLGPLLPAASALSTERTAQQMGDILVRATRYATVILLGSGLPLIVLGYWVLRLWVGANYAEHSIRFLRILLLANIIRNLCSPYATMVVATAKQRVATAAAVTEALVNLVASIWLAKYYGALGVALGTLIGSLLGVLLHFAVSMRYTRNISPSRMQLLAKGMLRPAAMAIPSVLLLPLWWHSAPPVNQWILWTLWAISTLLLAWLVSMSSEDRQLLAGLARRRLGLA